MFVTDFRVLSDSEMPEQPGCFIFYCVVIFILLFVYDHLQHQLLINFECVIYVTVMKHFIAFQCNVSATQASRDCRAGASTVHHEKLCEITVHM